MEMKRKRYKRIKSQKKKKAGKREARQVKIRIMPMELVKRIMNISYKILKKIKNSVLM